MSRNVKAKKIFALLGYCSSGKDTILKQVLKEAGIKNYTIWNVGNELFGYFECERGVKFAEDYQAQSSVVDKWNEYMKDVMVMELDPQTGAQPKMQQVFFLE